MTSTRRKETRMRPPDLVESAAEMLLPMVIPDLFEVPDVST
jgi:hypothetical protein